MPDLILSDIVKSYGAATALDGASLHLRGGEVHALMGENGAGKSTLIRILAGLERPDAGRIEIFGRPLGPGGAQAAGLRFLHQELQVVAGLSVAENMHLARPYPRRLGFVDWGALNRAAATALTRLGLERIAPATPMGALGPGDQMLVRIAATLIADGGAAPWAYVMDEPTAALTGAEAERLFAVIDSLRAGGAGILYVSHRMDEVMRLADRVTVLRDGRSVSSRAIGQTDQARIIHDMTGREIATLYPDRAMPGGTTRLALESVVAGPLSGVSLEVAAGEVVGLAGLAGTGRGALLGAVMGAVPRQGSVRVDGQLLRADTAAAWAAGLAWIPRERRAEGIMPGLALRETVALPHLARMTRAGLVSRAAERATVARLAGDVRLKAQGPDQPCAELSGGNQQKVLFARALAGDLKVLVLDEPTRGVDVAARFDIYALVRGLSAQGVAVLMSSSDLPELIGLSHRIAVLGRGRVAEVLPAEGLDEAGLLARCYAAMEG
ncbi:MAG: ATP-binding cassette domain-containing protein [Limimaricola sp.]|uniref:sugar ABC transporter ATP-binding protein n=1 Tax=Limimaricola sp. TaxID=2211665 RepID=UPI001DE47C54|nr:sugar ABC transporter ATP-binding protein [Limimaricola sp.]MBI1416587.1 ATP-binding cassette domain-containing protein [Limimaricola sp.]